MSPEEIKKAREIIKNAPRDYIVKYDGPFTIFAKQDAVDIDASECKKVSKGFNEIACEGWSAALDEIDELHVVIRNFGIALDVRDDKIKKLRAVADAARDYVKSVEFDGQPLHEEYAVIVRALKGLS